MVNTWDQLTVEAESVSLGDGHLRALANQMWSSGHVTLCWPITAHLAEADDGLGADGEVVGDGGGLIRGDLACVALQ